LLAPKGHLDQGRARVLDPHLGIQRDHPDREQEDRDHHSLHAEAEHGEQQRHHSGNRRALEDVDPHAHDIVDGADAPHGDADADSDDQGERHADAEGLEGDPDRLEETVGKENVAHGGEDGGERRDQHDHVELPDDLPERRPDEESEPGWQAIAVDGHGAGSSSSR